MTAGSWCFSFSLPGLRLSVLHLSSPAPVQSCLGHGTCFPES